MTINFLKKYDFRKYSIFTKYEQIFYNHKVFEKTVLSKTFNRFQRKSLKKLNYASMGRQWCSLLISHQKDITIGLVIMKTTTNTGKNQKFSEKVQEESVEAIQIIGFSPRTLAMIHWTSSLSQWDLSILG